MSAIDSDFLADEARLRRAVRAARETGRGPVRLWAAPYHLRQLRERGWAFRTLRRLAWRDAEPRGAWARIEIEHEPGEETP